MLNEINRLKAIIDEDLPQRLTRADSSLPPLKRDSLGFSLSHTHRLAIPLGGCHTMETVREGQLIRVKQTRGGATFMPTGVWNRVDWYVPVEVATFIFEERETYINYVTCPGDGRVSNHLTRILYPPLDREGRILLDLLLACGVTPKHDKKAILLTRLLIGHILEMDPDQRTGGKGDMTYRKICSWLNENWTSHPSRSETAALFKITPNHLSHLFKKRGQISFSSYLNKLRMDQAKKLLTQSSLTMGEIAFHCGMGDPAYFCRVFKKETGLTPLAYRLSTSWENAHFQ